MQQVCELWERAFRDGFAPSMTTDELTALADACEADSPFIVQGQTTIPPPLLSVLDWPCVGGCAIGYAAWKGGCETVGEVEERFAVLCQCVDANLKEYAESRRFTNWFDDTPRATALAQVARVCREVLANRSQTT